MAELFDDTPEALVDLQTSVKDWVRKGREALLTFKRDDGSFWRDSRQIDKTKPNIGPTTTARAYMALVNIDRCLADKPDDSNKNWQKGFTCFVEEKSFSKKKVQRKQFSSKTQILHFENDDLNVFEIAHMVDLEFTNQYFERFQSSLGRIVRTEMQELKRQKFVRLLRKNLAEILQSSTDEEASKRGEYYFDFPDTKNEKRRSEHFFVTLHLLRASSILQMEDDVELNLIEQLTIHAEDFCIAQCFFAQQRLPHKQDAARLAFASVIYCLYAKAVDSSVCIAAIKGLAKMQQENGRWPAAFPIIRPKQPWFIASDEIALCLTWLYFEPRVPDAARPILLNMMEAYFTKWVKLTLMSVPPEENRTNQGKFKGWQDDHSMGRGIAVGWVTAIVCHFLANYHAVLADHINRRVIETLGLQAKSRHYLVDATHHKFSPRWSMADAKKREMPTWFDVPPFGWRDKQDSEKLAEEIAWHWTDPEPGDAISKALAEKVLQAVFDDPAGRPKKDCCSGILGGSPGTRKTTLVKSLARILNWPLVEVPASTFFEDGFDGMEARGNVVFRRLNYLTGCVIFFDEFEEFFRDRGENGNENGASPHDRTIAAYTTSSMLPRLQDLHDEGRNLIFLATNHIEKIDSAIIRPGRFDFQLRIEDPTIDRFLDENSYLTRTTKLTLEKLNIEFDAATREITGEEKLGVLRSAVQPAIEKAKSRLKKLNKLKRKGKNQESCKFATITIPFKFVEAALEAIERLYERNIRNKTELTNAATSKLISIINDALTDKKGPPDLVKSPKKE